MSVGSLIIGKGDTKGRVPIHCDDSGNLYVVGTIASPSGSTPTNYASAAKEKSKVLSAAAAVLFSVNVMNTTANEVFVLMFDATALPANGAVPVDFAVVPAAGPGGGWGGGIFYGDLGRLFSNGIVIAISSTPAELTIASGDDYLISARFKA